MCDYTNASYRLGRVVSAHESSTDEKIHASVSQAWKIGERIILKRKNYEAAILDSLRSAGEGDDTVIVEDMKFTEGDRIRSRFAPGLIVDFPQVELGSDFGAITVRTCLTVCSEKRESKLWSRATTHFQDQHFSTDWISKFKESAKRLATHLNNSVSTLYQQEFDEVLGRETEFKVAGNLHLMAVDCLGDSIDEHIREAVENVAWSEEPPQNISSVKLSAAMRDVTQATQFSSATLDRNPNTSEFDVNTDERSALFPFVPKGGGEGIFISHSLADDAFMVGLVASFDGEKTKQSDEERFSEHQHLGRRYPAAAIATSQLATFLGGKF
ncbi:MAG: hypothetical protein AAF647_02095 [Pseudomonadota bacterium]